MTDIEITGGTILASLNDRTITGLLLPYGEVGHTNAGRFEVQAGAIPIPADPSIVGLNLDHDRFKPVGRASRLWEEPAGIFATFTIANTPDGDAALADATSPRGTRRRLSAEFTATIKDGKATGGILAGSALVAMGAFPSAAVLAEAIDDTTTTTDTPTVDDLDEDDTTTDTPDLTEDEETTEETTEVTATAIPTTQLDTAPAATTTDRPTDLRAVLAAFADVKANPNAESAVAVLAALADIKMTGTGALPTGGGVIQPTWLGQLYQGIPYVREYITLGTLGTNITAGGKKGYKLHRGTSAAPIDHFDGTWAGNKANINGGTGWTESSTSEVFRFALGNDIAREFYDLPGGAEVVEAFLRLLVEDHLVWSDSIALQTWQSVAGAPIAPKVYPGVDGHDYGSSLGMLIQGILAVKAKKADGRRDVPTFAIVNELAFEELIYTPKDLIPEFVSFSASTDGTGRADSITIVQGDTGVEATPSVIVGAASAVEFDELPGGPLHIDALDLARGGIDKAVHGYLQRFVVRPEAVVHIGTADVAG